MCNLYGFKISWQSLLNAEKFQVTLKAFPYFRSHHMQVRKLKMRKGICQNLLAYLVEHTKKSLFVLPQKIYHRVVNSYWTHYFLVGLHFKCWLQWKEDCVHSLHKWAPSRLQSSEKSNWSHVWKRSSQSFQTLDFPSNPLRPYSSFSDISYSPTTLSNLHLWWDWKFE